MNELDLLKKHWQNSEKDLPQYSFEKLYEMILKKSSSIVKWILIISLIEFALWGLLYFSIPEGSLKLHEDLGLKNPMLISTILTLVMFIFFISLFYYNYSKIRITDSVKLLMERILKTRKTVYFFIIWNIASTALAFILISFYYNRNKEKLLELIYNMNPEVSSEHSHIIFSSFLITFIFTALIIIGLMFLIYRIVYVRLLKSLNDNYRQLKNIESNN